MRVPDHLRYTREHEWAAREGDEVTVGVTDYAQGELGDIVFVELPKVGHATTALQPCGVLEAVKTVADLFAPVSGTVTAVNTTLLDSPAQINKDPYGAGWIVKIRMSDAGEYDRLLSGAEYAKLVQ